MNRILVHHRVCTIQRIAIPEIPRPNGDTMVTVVEELHRVASAYAVLVAAELGQTQRWIDDTCGDKIAVGVQIVASSCAARKCIAHAGSLTIGEHPRTKTILHVILHIVEIRTTARTVEIAAHIANGIGCVCYKIVEITVRCFIGTIRRTPGMIEVQPMAYFVRQCAGIRYVRGFD